MSDVPFGFGAPDRGEGDDKPGAPFDPFGAFGLGMGQAGPADLGAALQQLGQLLSWTGGPVNWDLARDIARGTVSARGDRSTSAVERREVDDAVRLAELWLDGVTDLAAGTTSAAAWSRAEWVEQTLSTWQQLVDPVAARVVDAMSSSMSAQLGQLGEQGAVEIPGLGQLPGQLAGQLGGQLGAMMRSMGGAMFGSQVGQAIGALAGEVVSSTDVGVPLGPNGRAVLVPMNIAAFGEGLEVPADQVRLFLALREAAHHRLFAHVPWLRGHLVAELESYARGISIDTSRIEEAVTRLDPTNPEALQEALTGGLFEPQNTPEQQRSLARLETLLALVEGWVDHVVDAAAAPHLPAAAALRETVRRRRAAGGPAEQTFASLVGLELRPRRLREAATLWTALRDERGAGGRDEVWSHPDLLPTPDDLDDPSRFARGESSIDVRELERLGSGEDSPEAGAGSGEEPDGPPEAERPDGPATPGGPGGP